jgi:hypothetical protein
MKKTKMLMLLAVALLTACSSDIDEQKTRSEKSVQEVTLTFSPYQVEAMTRAATSIAGIVTHLDVWLYDGNTEAEVIHQSSDDADFGTVTATLDKTKTYTIYAVGHKATGAATLADGVITWPDNKVTHAMYYTATFTPSTTTHLSCLMQRIVAQFRIETTDVLPSDLKTISISIGDVFTRWNVMSFGENKTDYTYTINVTGATTETVALNVYAIVSETQTLHTVTVTGLDADNGVVLSPRTFADVPLRNGYRTTYRGSLRNESVTGTFTVEDWNEYDVVNF